MQRWRKAARKAGPWLVCRPGCAECCIGSFEISALDAERLRTGLADLAAARARARGPDRGAGEALRTTRGRRSRRDTLAPRSTPNARLRALRIAPLTCRLFGPPVRGASGAIGVCELCFHGASEEEIAACEMTVAQEALAALEFDRDDTTVALALLP